MATSKKGGKKASGKTKTKGSKKSKPKASQKKVAKKAKKAPVKTKVKVVKKAKPKVAQKNKTKAAKKVKKAPVKSKVKVVKKAKPKASPKNKIEAPERKIIKEATKPARVSRGDVIVSDTTLDKLYIVNDSNNIVTLEVNAGDKGQTSDMTIKLDDKIIANELAGDFNETALGTNKELNGKKLSIVATIADTSRETNLTSLTIHVRGGFSSETFPLSKEVEQEGESVDYLCLIEFFRPE